MPSFHSNKNTGADEDSKAALLDSSTSQDPDLPQNQQHQDQHQQSQSQSQLQPHQHQRPRPQGRSTGLTVSFAAHLRHQEDTQGGRSSLSLRKSLVLPTSSDSPAANGAYNSFGSTSTNATDVSTAAEKRAPGTPYYIALKVTYGGKHCYLHMIPNLST
jgi:hypothetical protein